VALSDAEGATVVTRVEIEVFHDGECPLCQREMQLLQRLDRANAIRFVDISAGGFDPVPLGVSWQMLMERIHARLPDGTLIEGVEVFRRLYAAIGFRRLAAFSRLPVVAQLLDVAYHLFAKNRLRLTGRCTDGACPVHARGAAQARAASEAGARFSGPPP
jgi:predicted DCC family thiol-disulfide oxidoreductase YuxK